MSAAVRTTRCLHRLLALVTLLLFGASAMAAEGTIRGSLESGGRTRGYVLHVPQSVATGGGKPVALVVALHGGGGNGNSNIEQTGFNDLADREGFIVVHPDGTGVSRPLLNAFGKARFYTWNAGSCCGYAVQHQIDDVGFIRALVKTLEQRYPIDPKRIYATGISNGGMLSYRLACEASDVFAAIGVVSGAQTSHCKPSAPVSVIHIHGSADQNVVLTGGIGAKALDKTAKPPVMDAINFWIHADGLGASPQITERGNIRKQLWTGGHGGAEVVFYLINGAGHAWPGGSQLASFLDKPTQEFSATPVIWDFFKAHPKP